MERASLSHLECPIARAVDEIGDAWSLLVLRETYKGASTFSEIQAGLPITPTTLTRRLEALTARGLLAREAYQSRPARSRYVLTDKALDLMPVLLALGAWGNRWLSPKGPLLELVDGESGAAIDLAIVDRTTGRSLEAGRVALRPGPGASRRLRGRLTRPLLMGGQPACVAPGTGADSDVGVGEHERTAPRSEQRTSEKRSARAGSGARSEGRGESQAKRKRRRR